MSSVEKNKEIVRRWSEYLNTGDLGIYDELAAPNYVVHQTTGDAGIKELKAIMPTLREALPDCRATVEDMIAEGDRVAVRYTIRGTHKGTFSGIPATGNPVSFTGTTFYRLAGGKIVEDWSNPDGLTFLQQIGAVRQFP